MERERKGERRMEREKMREGDGEREKMRERVRGIDHGRKKRNIGGIK